MKPYLLSLAVGVLVGVIYGVMNVKSPAPPVVALVGLLGMLGGEQVAKHWGEWRAWVGLATPSQAGSGQRTDQRAAVQAPTEQHSDTSGG